MSKLFNWLKRSKPEQNESMADRFIEYAKYKGIAISNLCNHCRIGHGRYIKMKYFPENVIKKICNACPDLNPQWFRNGEGEMIIADAPAFAIIFHKPEPRYTHGRSGKCIDRVKEFVKYKKITLLTISTNSGFAPSVFSLSKLNRYNDITDIAVEKILAAYPEINPDWMWFGNGEMILEENNLPSSENACVKHETTSQAINGNRRIDRLTQYMMMNNLTDEDVKLQCGLSPEYLPHVRQGMYDLSPEMIHRICDKYHKLNPEWVRTGEGQMLDLTKGGSLPVQLALPHVAVKDEKTLSYDNSSYDRLLKYIKYKGITIEKVREDCRITKYTMDKAHRNGLANATSMKILKKYTDLSPNWLYKGIGEMIIKESKHEKKPVINTAPNAIPVFNGYVNGQFVKNTTHGGFTDKSLKDCIGGMEMQNKTMEPLIPKGSIIFLREHKNIDYIDWGMLYMVILNDDIFFVGKLYPQDDYNIICRRYNQERYPDITIRKKDICKIYLVKGIRKPEEKTISDEKK